MTLEMVRIIIAFILFVIAIFVGLSPMVRYFSKTLPPDTLSISILIINCIALFIMIATIMFNHKSSMEQIKTMHKTSIDQIGAIRDATQTHIKKIEDLQLKSKDALLSALLLEYANNIRNIKEILSHEEEYKDTSEKGKIAQNVFSYEAYQANLNNATINDQVLVDKLVQVYGAFKLFQSFIDTARTPMLSRSSSAGSLSKVIDMMKKNLPQIEALYGEIEEYKEKNYGNKETKN